MTFDGATYQPARDKSRLKSQLEDVLSYMLDGAWHTLFDIETETGHPVQSVSARLRDLRKKKFGGYTIERSNVGGGIFVYRLA